MNIIPEEIHTRVKELKAIGYRNLQGADRAQWGALKSEYPELFKKAEDEDQAAAPAPVANTENPFAGKVATKEPVKQVQIDQGADYIFVDNVLHGEDYFAKNSVIQGSHPLAQYFANRNLIIKK